ncbi:recombinase family protein [Rhodococcus sp. 1168]|uniref:recombinase family protein n=2 Tax=unclassified Rhodococcus (in: high G+C Gram-positive bacteria) TaxID=192944 RepID=UPI000A0BBD11|nr:recombinase family protein [Rhodococcus sp. 1168]ORI28150.1 DNA resolvase [Rhodococcus sp. 1168]
MKVGYARCSTVRQDTAVQVGLLTKAGVHRDHIYIDHGISGRQAKRPGLENAINASREGDEFCVTKLDRLSRSAGDLHETVDRLAARGVALSIDGKVYDPTDPMGKMFIGMLGLMAEFESDLIRSRTRDAIAAAGAAGRMKGRPHTLTPEERAYLLRMYETRRFKIETLCKNNGLKRSALYKNLQLARAERDSLTESAE